jgi:hypothetical protein
MAKEDYSYDTQEALMSHCVSKSEEKYGPENGRDGGHEYRKGPEIGRSSMQMRVRHIP